MHRIDSDGAAVALPTPGAVGATVGYFTEGDPGLGVEATVVSADFLNAVQEELGGVITDLGLTLDKTKQNQLVQAIRGGSLEPRNLGLAASVGSSALTVALKDRDGSNPSADSQVIIPFRSSTLDSGVYTRRRVTSALSVVVSSGSTLGTKDALAHDIYVYAIDNAGTVELAVSRVILDEGVRWSTTAEGGAGAADSNAVLYSTTARTNVPIRLIGRLRSTQTTAGTWAAAPTEIALVPFANRKISALYESNAGQSISAGPDIVNFEDIVFDKDNCVTIGAAWKFTAPKAALYRITAQITFTWNAFTTTQGPNMIIYKNGTSYRNLQRVFGNGGSIAITLFGSALVSLAAGDYISVSAGQDSGGSLALVSDAKNNFVEVVEVTEA